MTDEKILSKIKKCLALSQSSEPHEAAAALRQAQKLMEAHGVSQADLQLADIGEVKVRSTASVSKIKNWELNLLSLVTKAFGCSLIWTHGNSWSRSAEHAYGHYTIIGLKAQVPIAEYTAQVLLRKLRKSRGEFTSALPGYLTRQEKTREADGFCLGWVAAISRTVHEFAKTPELESAIRKYKEVKWGELKDADVQSRRAGQYGYAAGHEAAAGESLNRPMNDKSPTLRLQNN